MATVLATSIDYDQAPAERKPGEFRRHPRTGAPYVAHPTDTRQPTGNKAELQAKCRDRGLDDTGTIPELKARLGAEPKMVIYGRPSSLGKQIENTTNLQKWSERAVALGLHLDPAIAADLARLTDDQLNLDDDEARHLLDTIAVKAKQVARTGLAADRGTHTHALTEDADLDGNWLARAAAGEDLGIPVAAQRALVAAWEQMLERHTLQILAVEATCVDDAWRQAGTLDRIARLGCDLSFVVAGGEIVTLTAGTVVVLDVKTGGLRRDRGVISYWHSYSVQIASYAQSVPYDPDTDTRSVWDWPIDQRWALIAHLDVAAAIDGEAAARLVLVDLEAGREAGERCVWARGWEKRGDVFSLVTDTDAAAPITVPVASDIPNESEADDDFDAPQIAAPSHSPEVEQPASTDDGTHGMAPSSVEAPRWRLGYLDAPFVRLAEPPDEGAANVDAVALRERSNRLDGAQRAWIGTIVQQSQRAGGSLHMGEQATERRLAACTALVDFAAAFIYDGQNDGERRDLDDILRAALARVIDPDAAHAAAHPVGAIIAALDVSEAKAFAVVVARTCSLDLSLGYRDDGRPVLMHGSAA